ncbi:MAG: sigma-70 family RNA polymerase sigma factor [Thermoleophilia bacterium]|nr:sigma-70 family RNA polymerase sigma factor [Thermoleophilia bacterium]
MATRALTGDRERFVELLKTHDRGLRSLAYRLLGDRDCMDDVLQEAYLKAYRALPGFRGDAEVGTWLYRIVYNASVDCIRRDATRQAVPLTDLTNLASRRHDDPAVIVAGRQDLAAALAALPPEQRAAVLLVDAQGFDHALAADVMGVPVGTVGSRLHRARAALRQALGDTYDAEEGR